MIKTCTRFVMVCSALLSLALTAHAWEPNAGDLDKAIQAGDFTQYLAGLSAWLDPQVPAKASDTTLKVLLENPVFLNALAQRQLIAKHGADALGAFAKAGNANKGFLAWLLGNAEAMDLYLIAATPTGLAKREANSYSLNTASLTLWKKIIDADPNAKAGIYLKLAMATALSPPPAMSYVGAGGKGAVPVDPVERYMQFKTAHQNKELFPIFDTLSVWEYRKLTDSWASDGEMVWVRKMLNTWRPDLRKNQQVHKIVSEVWRRNSPFFYTKGFVTVLEGGGKCGPRSWMGRMTCRSFGIPSVGVGQPGHAAFAIKAVDPASDPQPGSIWKVVYGRAWHVSKCEGVKGPEFVTEAALRSHEPQFSQGEHLRWLASALTSKERAEAVMAIARTIHKSAPKTELVRKVAMPTTPSIPESPIKVTAGVIHVEAESFSAMSKALVYDCFTGGKQVNFQKNIDKGSIDYRIDAPAAGTYALTLRVATPNREQIMNVESGKDKLATVDIPNTTGLWGTTEPVSITLSQGVQTLRLSTPYQRGIALRWLELKPEK
ncbi:carbohydrate-binding protein [bacterium]|nr:carbohydrate-binding protein [bacterium]